MRILAIDATSEFGSLALARGTEIVDVISLHSREGFGHLIFQLVDRHSLKLADLVSGRGGAACHLRSSAPGDTS